LVVNSNSVLRFMFTSRKLLCAVAVFGFAAGQDLPQSFKPQLDFDVVSIRPSNPGPNDWMMRIRSEGDEYEARGMPLGNTILMAFFPTAVQSKERISGAPNWIWEEKYDFIGKVSAEHLEEWRSAAQHGFGTSNSVLEEMLQTALADRCKLIVHRIPATRPGYALVIAKRGVNRNNLNEAKPEDSIPRNAQRIPWNGRMVPIMSPDEPVSKFFDTSMKSFAEQLSRGGAPVVDQTGLVGTYRFNLTRLSNTGDPGVDVDVAALGLRLVRIQIPTETIVIDHIERPSPN
jgi:uncharacterized protein (TIGR03435 family)